jgi:hypothetical protein
VDALAPGAPAGRGERQRGAQPTFQLALHVESGQSAFTTRAPNWALAVDPAPKKLTCHQRRVEFERGPVKGPVLLVGVSARFGRRHGLGPLAGLLRGSRGRFERPDHRHSHDIQSGAKR